MFSCRKRWLFQELMHPDMDESSFTNSALRLISQQRQRPKKKRTKEQPQKNHAQSLLEIMHRPFFLWLNGWTQTKLPSSEETRQLPPPNEWSYYQ
jgi:hypothetical protein